MLNHLFFVIFFFLPITNFAQDVATFLSKIPLQDRQQLEKFFYTIIHNNSGCYTLFGDKPVTLSADFILTFTLGLFRLCCLCVFFRIHNVKFQF